MISKRMLKSWDEISHWDSYDYVLVNDDIDMTEADLKTIVSAERMRRAQQIPVLPVFRPNLDLRRRIHAAWAEEVATQRSIERARIEVRTGLQIVSFMPTARHRCLSSSAMLAVSAITGRSLPASE